MCHEALIELHNEASDREVKAARVKAEEERQFILDKAKRAIKGDFSKQTYEKKTTMKKTVSSGSGGGGSGGGRLVGVSGNKRGTKTGAYPKGEVPKADPFTEQPLPKGLRVIVIGAGVSGLHCALQLERLGANVTVLEGRDRIGGRIRSEKLGLSLPADKQRVVDLGASFVCGTSTQPPLNPMFQYAKATLGLTLKPKHCDGPQGNAWFDDDGRRLAPEETKTAEEQYDEVLDELRDVATFSSDSRLAISTVAQDVIDKLEPTGRERQFIHAYMSDLYVAPMEKLSLRGMVSDGYSGDHELVIGGYNQVALALRDGVSPDGLYNKPLEDVRLGSKVLKVVLPQSSAASEEKTRSGLVESQAVVAAADNVRRRTRAAAAASTSAACATPSKPKMARVHVEGVAKPLEAHAILCTLPLGVLQHGDVAFSPPLPEYKRKAIAALGMGTENRVAMLFDPSKTPFWPTDAHFLRPVHGRYTFANLHALGLTGVLCAWVRAKHIEEVEAMTDVEAYEDVMKTLRLMFPDTAIEPLEYKVTRWSQDPFSRGSYSYVPLGAFKTDYDRMAVPVTGDEAKDAKVAKESLKKITLYPDTRLFFAGEATHRADAYTVHGAFASGEREARNIAKWWRQYHDKIL